MNKYNLQNNVEITAVLPPSVAKLFEDDSFCMAWEELVETELWRDKSPGALRYHLLRLARYPVGFATEQVVRAIYMELPFVIQDAIVDRQLDEWEERTYFPPTVENVKAYCLREGLNVPAEYFVQYYAARNWHDKDGVKVMSWHNKVRKWHLSGIFWKKHPRKK